MTFLCCALQKEFAEVFEVSVDQDVNRVLFALRRPAVAAPDAASMRRLVRGAVDKQDMKELEFLLSSRLQLLSINS